MQLLLEVAVLLFVSAAAPAAGAVARSDNLVAIEWAYMGDNCDAKPYRIFYYLSANEYSGQFDNCKMLSHSAPDDCQCIVGNKARGTTYKRGCTVVTPDQLEKGLPLPGYLCELLYDAEGPVTDCTSESLSYVSCWTMQDLGKNWPKPASFSLAPNPTDAGTQAGSMTLTYYESNKNTYQKSKCKVYKPSNEPAYARKAVW